MSEEELKNYEANFASGLWESQERPPYTLSCVHCGKETEYVFMRVWKNLTDKEIEAAGHLHVEGERMLPYSFARAIEAKLKEKNS